MVALFALGVVMNTRLSNRTEDLERGERDPCRPGSPGCATGFPDWPTEQRTWNRRTRRLPPRWPCLRNRIPNWPTELRTWNGRTRRLPPWWHCLRNKILGWPKQYNSYGLADYWLASPEVQSMSLKPPSGTGSSRGILVVDQRRTQSNVAVGGNGRASAVFHLPLMADAGRGSKVWAAKLTSRRRTDGARSLFNLPSRCSDSTKSR